MSTKAFSPRLSPLPQGKFFWSFLDLSFFDVHQVESCAHRLHHHTMLIQQLDGDRCLVGVQLDELPQRRHHLPSAALIDALIHDLDEVLFLLYSHATTMLPQAPRGGACALIEHPRASQPPAPCSRPSKHTANHKPGTTSRTATSSSIDVFFHTHQMKSSTGKRPQCEHTNDKVTELACVRGDDPPQEVRALTHHVPQNLNFVFVLGQHSLSASFQLTHRQTFCLHPAPTVLLPSPRWTPS